MHLESLAPMDRYHAPARLLPQTAAALATNLLLSGALTGQELEWHVPARGAHVYDRTIDHFDYQAAADPAYDWVIQGAVPRGSAGEPHAWRYLPCDRESLPEGFAQVQFDDSSWAIGPGEFGDQLDSNPRQRTAWTTSTLCLRTQIDLGERKPKLLWIEASHDDSLTVWLNGSQVLVDERHGRNRQYAISGKQLTAWQPGQNTIAIRCEDIGGAKYLDVAMAQLDALPDSTQLTERATGARRHRAALFCGYRAPAVLLHGELNNEASALKAPADELRELGSWLGFNLRYGTLGGEVLLEAPRLFRVGDIRLAGRASPIDADGWQSMEVSVASTEQAAAQGESQAYIKEHILPLIIERFEGKLRVLRRIRQVGKRAFVSDLRTTLEGRVFGGEARKQHVASIRYQETWRHRATRNNQDAEFRAAVAESIRRGTDYLRSQLADVNNPQVRREQDGAERSYGSGRLALGLLALLKSGINRTEPIVTRCLDELRQRTLLDTYALGNALMAMEAYYAPLGEDVEFKAGRINKPAMRKPSASDKALMERWVERLLANVDAGVNSDKVLRFHYTGGSGFDNSTTQYGLLGLHSARLCGIKLPENIWQAAAKHWCDEQAKGGQRTSLRLIDFRTQQKLKKNPRASVRRRVTAFANGWSYRSGKVNGVDAPTWGSMTCAGLTGLAICESGMRARLGSRRTDALRRVIQAREDGFAWLSRKMAARTHPGALARRTAHIFYYLYSLERAALLSSVAIIGDRDWYFEGAMALIESQQEDGNWIPDRTRELSVATTAMAVLFLKQSTMPVLTGR